MGTSFLRVLLQCTRLTDGQTETDFDSKTARMYSQSHGKKYLSVNLLTDTEHLHFVKGYFKSNGTK